MNKTKSYLIITAVLVFALFGFASHAKEGEKTLYQRLGGYDAIAAVVDDFAGRLINDPS